MRILRILFSVICLAVTLSLFGQDDFKPGYIIGPDQDTISGQIKTNSESRNARICIFRTGEDAEASEFYPGEIDAYRITGGKYYVSSTVEKDGEKELVFLEYLVNGIADLYYLREDNSETYYIKKEDKDALALTDIRLLKATFSDCYEIQSSLDKATLNHKSLVDMTVKYHDYVCKGEECIDYTREASRVKIQVGPVLGYSISSLQLQGSVPFDLYEFPNSQSPVFGILLDLHANRLGENLSFQLGIEYSKHSFQASAIEQGSVYYVDYIEYNADLESSLLSFQLGTSYSFRGQKVRPFIGGGVQLSKFVSPDFYYSEDIYYINWNPDMLSNAWEGNPVESLMFGVYASAGLNVKLSEKLMLVSSIRAGYLTSNPNTLMALEGGEIDQMRIRPTMIPLSLHIGILF